MRGGTNPYRVIIDSSLKIPLNARVLNHPDNKTIITTTKKADQKKIRQLRSRGVTVLVIKDKEGKVDLKSLMKKLGTLNITSVMIEGGSLITASSLSSKIVDKVMVFIAPKIIGGIDAIPSVGGKSPALLKNAIQLKNLQVTHFGADILLEGYPKYK